MISGTYTNIWIALVDYIYLRNKKKKKCGFIHEPIESGHLGVIGTFVISRNVWTTEHKLIIIQLNNL